MSVPTGSPSAASPETVDGSGHPFHDTQMGSGDGEEAAQSQPAAEAGAPGEAGATGALSDADAAGGGARAGDVTAAGGGAEATDVAAFGGGAPGSRSSVDGPPSTGDPAVDEALQELSGLLDQPLTAQVEGYAAVHARLQNRLADLDG